MKLIPVSEHPDATQILWDLLAERPAYANISHKQMPTWHEHAEFVRCQNPYEAWYLIEETPHIVVGAIYLTFANEIGVGIFQKYQQCGYGSDAVVLLMMQHGERNYLANIAPLNQTSMHMFEKLGFKPIQVTFALEAK